MTLRQILNDNIIIIQLNDSLARLVYIGVELPIMVYGGLIEFLKAKTNLFVVSPKKIYDIDLRVACHRLNIDLSIHYLTQQRRRHYPDKAKVTWKTVNGL